MTTKHIITVAMLICASLTASAQTRAQKEEVINRLFTGDERCLQLAELAGAIGDAQEAGDNEAKIIRRGMVGDWSDRIFKTVVKFVYTMKLDAENARQMVFMKCKMSEYNPTVEEVAKR